MWRHSWPGLRPVGDLVPVEPGGAEPLGGGEVLVGLVVVVGVAVGVGGQRRARLDGEGVGGHVRRVEGDRVVERAAPVVEGLAGAAVDEVEVERGEAGGDGQLDGSLDVGAVVGAAERLQHVGRRGLHAEGQAVHAAGEVGVEQLRR